TGEGVFSALHGAELASEVAAAALKAGECSAERLATYQRARRRTFAAKARFTHALQFVVAHRRLANLTAPLRVKRPPLPAPRKSGPRERDATLRRFLAMLGAVPADSVLVLAANDNVAAHFGELSAEWLRSRRVRGAVIDGATRDATYISRIRFPTFVRYRTPQDSIPRWRVSDWGQPLTIGGVRIALDDVIVADLDGVVVVPRRAAH